ncbi:MAG: DJ-1/PfpI family protein [Candidatus Micrarchaeia archaeon]
MVKVRVAIFVPPKDFRDETLSMVKLILEKWKVDGIITSYTTKECIGKHGAVYKPAINTAKVDPAEFDGIVLIDGDGVESYKLYDFRPLLDLVKRFYESKKIVGAIGNAIKIIARANIILDTKISAPIDEETQRLMRIYYGLNSPMEVEADKNIITARNPENADAFAQILLEKLGVK